MNISASLRFISSSAAALLLGCSPSPVMVDLEDSDGESATETYGACVDGNEGCACYPNETCNDGLTCLSMLCVDASSLDVGDEGPSTSTSGTTGSNPTPPPADGDSGDSGPAGACGGAPSNTLDNFFSCDTSICEIEGRSGEWFAFADDDVSQSFMVSMPTEDWVDTSCAAWTQGGSGGGAADFAIIGFPLAGGEPYDASGYSGVTVEMESGGAVLFIARTTGNGAFGGWLWPTVGTEARSLAFSELFPQDGSDLDAFDPTQIVDFLFAAENPFGFGYAIHGVSFD
ncbi:MAG: hypothetical protein AAF799_04210 [Myxococcota bacterium]